MSALTNETNVLVVGAGGIGCELLKNLVMTGFKNITIVDLDKIEKSNLNRQFLYDKECIGKYKSEMARNALLRLRKNLNITAYVGNIKDTSRFNYAFFRSFDVILNALDNIEARTYINKVCQDLNLKLVNSGTEGFFGSVSCHIKNLTECYNCTYRSKKAKIPICSIRSKPEKIEHCIAWGKALFELMFCNTSDNLLSDYTIDSDCNVTFNKLFNEDLKRDIKDDIPLTMIDVNDYNTVFDYNEFNQNIYKYDDKILPQVDLIAILKFATHCLGCAKYEGFDKENKDIVNFVLSASNLRAINFNIKAESRFKVKEIAGNIVPAIASTNAIIAAVQCIETLKLILGQNNLLRNANLQGGRVIRSLSSLGEKRKDCLICSTQTQCINVELNMGNYKLIDFIEKVIVAHFYMNEFSITSNGNLLYERGNDLDEEDITDYIKVASRGLVDLGIAKLTIRDSRTVEVAVKNNNEMNGLEFTIIDFSQEVEGDENLLGRKRQHSDDEIEEMNGPNKKQRTEDN
jgi:ubiquitin-like 1-activating enzyme E1 B